jgi:hypothetical protein
MPAEPSLSWFLKRRYSGYPPNLVARVDKATRRHIIEGKPVITDSRAH